VLALFVFWPLGIVLLIRKLSKDRAATFNVKCGKLVSVVGWILVVFGVLGTAAFISDGDFEPIWFTSVFVIGGLFVLWRARRMVRNGKKYKHYISIVVNEGVTDINEIAEAAGVDQKEVEKDLQSMLDKGYFRGHINHKSKELVLAREGMGNTGNMKLEIVRCASCGANNKVAVGRTRRCEFCRTLIGAEDVRRT
jgi:hypothetical protein